MRLHNGANAPEQAHTDKPDLQAVLEHYGAHIYHSGKVICVFHDETQPSLSVDLEAQLFKCFSCGAAGDSWSAIQLKEGVDFKGARDTAAAAGFASSAHDGGGDDVQSVFGRRRPAVHGGSRAGGRGRRGRPWSRPW